MRTKLFTAMIALALLIGCSDEDSTTPDTKACFDYSPQENLKVGDEITFTNCSEEATNYLWGFGDGNGSTDKNPTHTFGSSGEFIVKLLAANDYSVDSTSVNITINSAAPNGFNYDNTFYPTDNLTICDFSNSEDDLFVIILSKDVTYDCSTMEWSSGTGDAISFTIINDNISEGTYTMTANSEDNVVLGGFSLNYSPSTESAGTSGEFTSGTLTIRKLNDKYELTYDFNTDIGNINGYYLEN